LHVLPALVLSDRIAGCSACLIAPGTIDIVGKNNIGAMLTVDQSSYLPQKLARRNLDGAILEETYSNWRRVDDLMWR